MAHKIRQTARAILDRENISWRTLGKKKCKKCSEIKILEEFYGTRSLCKMCCREAARNKKTITDNVARRRECVALKSLGERRCKTCDRIKLLEDFHKKRETGYGNICKLCASVKNKNYKVINPKNYLLKRMRNSAKERGHDCSMTLDQIDIPDNCPLCQKRFSKNFDKHRDPDHPSPDRFDPRLGYNIQNVVWICWGCNQSKGNIKPEQIINMYLLLLARTPSAEHLLPVLRDFHITHDITGIQNAA